jgi:hypothetical protein
MANEFAICNGYAIMWRERTASVVSWSEFLATDPDSMRYYIF